MLSVSPGTSGNILSSDGSIWTSVTRTPQITNDTTTDRTQYIGMTTSTTGTWVDAYISASKFYFNPNTGTVSATSFNALSDITLKKNIVTIDNAFDILDKVNPVKFNWIENDIESYGVIAQEIEEILPSIVEESNGIKSVNYTQLIPLLISVVKQQQKDINRLKSLIK